MKTTNIVIAGAGTLFVVIMGSIIVKHETSSFSASASAQKIQSTYNDPTLAGSMARLVLEDLSADISNIQTVNKAARKSGYGKDTTKGSDARLLSSGQWIYRKHLLAAQINTYYLSQKPGYYTSNLADYLNGDPYGGFTIKHHECGSSKGLFASIESWIKTTAGWNSCYNLVIHNKSQTSSVKYVPAGGVNVDVSVSLPTLTGSGYNDSLTTTTMIKDLDALLKSKYGINETGNHINFVVTKGGSISQ